MNDQNNPVSVDTITDRLSYVAWRADWRARYAAASQEIRDTKRELVRTRADWRRNAPNPKPNSYEYQVNTLIENLPWLRRKANLLMRERTGATETRDALIEEARTVGPAIAA
jgi:hypothetical protein